MPFRGMTDGREEVQEDSFPMQASDIKAGVSRQVFRAILFALPKAMNHTASRVPAFRERLKQRDLVAWIGLQDGSIGRIVEIRSGKFRSRSGAAAEAQVAMVFKDVATALQALMPNRKQSDIIHNAKNFKMSTTGLDDLVVWFAHTLNMSETAGLPMGTPMPDGSLRYTTCTNGGPVFVYVKDGRILRVTPIEFDNTDPPSWAIEARGRRYSPPRRGLVAPHALTLKSLVYSDKRILYPMKRVDFDPNSERNPQNRGKSAYVRISWEEALDIVAKEINRQKRVHGPGAITFPMSSHHQWGNVGYYLSALMRFANLIGFTRVAANPDSWEGWYWGAMHHFGNSKRVGVPAGYGGLEDCLKEAEMIVFWSSDPESTNGAYAGFEGTPNRLWAKELGIEFVHIDPHCNPTAQLLGGRWIPIRPQTDAALAQAIMYVWVSEGLYDKDYVANRTTGFDEWKAYLLGETDGAPRDSRMAGGGDRGSGQGCARARPHVGPQEGLSGLRNERRGIRRRQPRRDGPTATGASTIASSPCSTRSNRRRAVSGQSWPFPASSCTIRKFHIDYLVDLR